MTDLEWEREDRTGDLERYIAEEYDTPSGHVWAQIERTREVSEVFACWLLTIQFGSVEITSEARTLEDAKDHAEAFRAMLPKWNDEVNRREAMR